MTSVFFFWYCFLFVCACAATPAFGVVWGPDNDQLLFASGREITIKSMQADRKGVTWKAHDSVVMSVDWNVVNNLILSGGEDCKYKVRTLA